MDDSNGPRVTIVTLSRRAGVSPSTVSRALRGDPRISKSVRRSIAALAAEEGYLPNAVARGLASGRSGLIGLALGPTENPLYTQLMQLAVQEAATRGLRFLVMHAGEGAVDEDTAGAILGYQLDGCLITSADLSSRAAEICARHRVPVVMVSRVARLHASAVTCDNRGGARELASLLLEAGHRRFAVVHVGGRSSPGLERERGFLERLSEAGLTPVAREEAVSSYEAGYAAGQRLVAARPDAVFAVSDIIALGVMDALRAGGLRVPEDVSVTGFDDIAEAARPAYALTTAAQPLATMVTRALDLLEARIANPFAPDETITLGARVVRRGSARLG